MIPVKKLMSFTQEEKVLYKKYIELSEKSDDRSFIKVPVFWTTPICKASVVIGYEIIYSSGEKVCSKKFLVDPKENNKIVSFKKEGLSYAIILKRKKRMLLSKKTVYELIKLSYNSNSKWQYYS